MRENIKNSSSYCNKINEAAAESKSKKKKRREISSTQVVNTQYCPNHVLHTRKHRGTKNFTRFHIHVNCLELITIKNYSETTTTTEM